MRPAVLRPRALRVAAVLAAISAAGVAAQERFRAGVELVSLNVTVTDHAGRYVTDLDEREFEVFEDGAKQSVMFFSRTQQPIALSILLDTSASMEQQIATAQEAAVGFVRRMGPEDLMEIVDFDSQVRVLQTFTNDVASLERAIRGTTANGSTSLYNAIYIALRGLRRIQAASSDEIRRQAIVLLSDGDDTSSLVDYEEVREIARRSETVIFAIGLRENAQQRREFKEAEFVLRQLAQDTGGRAFFPGSAGDLARVYQQIWDELSSQYTIAYTSKNSQRNGAWRRVLVRTTRENLTARTRQGYFGPGS